MTVTSCKATSILLSIYSKACCCHHHDDYDHEKPKSDSIPFYNTEPGRLHPVGGPC